MNRDVPPPPRDERPARRLTLTDCRRPAGGMHVKTGVVAGATLNLQKASDNMQE